MTKKMPAASKPLKHKKPSRAPRAPNLDDDRILRIVKLLDGWTGHLTWDLFVDATEANVGGRYTRQALDRHVRIKDAYQQAKKRVGGAPKHPDQLTAKEMKRRADDYERLKNEVARLERENQNYAKQFARWVCNLRHMKITEDQLTRLDLPLSKIVIS